MNSSSLAAKMKKNKRKVLILSSFFSGLAFVGITVGISFTFKYNGKHPREEAQQFVKKVKYVAFNPEKISKNSDFSAIKSLLFDGNALKNTIKLDEYLIPYYFSEDSKQLVKFEQQSEKTNSPVFDFVDLNFDDLNQNFIIKFRARQQITDQNFAQSDFVLYPVSFYDSRKFLKADFNFVLQKITKKIEDAVSNFNTTISNFSEENSNLAQNNLYRASDFAVKINSSQDSSQVEKNLGQIFPKLTDLISSIRNSKENLIPETNAQIFDINFAKDATTNQFVSVQNNIATMFLQASLTQSALDQLGDNFENNGNKIININLESKDKKSIFLDVNDFFANVKLKPLIYNTEEKDNKLLISKQNPFDFFAKIKFESNPFLKNSTIKDLINPLLAENLSLDFGNFNKSIPSDKQGIDFIFDTPNAKLINDNGKYVIELPYKIVLNESFFDNNSNEIINEKQLVLRIEGFGLPINSNASSGNAFGNFSIPGTQKGIIYQQNPLFDNKSANLSQFISTFGEPIFAKVPLNKEELDNLLVKQDYKALAEKLSLPSSYNYNFDNFEAKVRSWAGKTLIPSLDDISRFKKFETTTSINSANSSQNLAVSSLVSNTFFQNPSDVAAFFANYIQQEPNKIAKTFFELAKYFGLLNQNRSSLQTFDDDLQEDIFKKAAKINLNNTNIQVLSFNNHFEDVFNQGFFSTLFLPQTIKNQIGDLTNKSTSEVLAALKDQEIFKKPNTNFNLNQIKENYKQSVKFSTLADVLLAFYLKSAQLSNFLAWEKIDSNLNYEIVFKKGNEISKQTLDQEIKKITEEPKPEQQESEGQPEGSESTEQTEGSGGSEGPEQTVQAQQPENVQQPGEAVQNLTDSKNYEYLTLNFYYNIGDENTSKFSLQTPVRKILINLSTEKIDPKVSDHEKLNSLADSIPSELLNFEVDDDTFNKISKPQTSTNGQQNSQNSQLSSLESNLINLKKTKEYFSKPLEKTQLRFDIFPSFENSIKTDTINFLLTVSILDKNSQQQGSDQNTTNQAEVLASRSLKISVKKSNNSQSTASNQQSN
ncbi:P97 family adhesin [Mesomycoplasma ovipneumoniae]|uniref:P97 family adhesin n=1 Tax=Mesomycoplasma ovipneumoniae TaxID=29562 RepID=UPI00311B4207